MGSALPSSAAQGPFDLFRGTDASVVKSGAAYDAAASSPWADSIGSLNDGQTHYYVVRDAVGVLIDVSVEKDRTNDRVLLSFDDTVPLPPADPALSSVTASPSSAPADGTTTLMVTIVPRDSSGRPLGPGLYLTIDLSLLAPAEQVGAIQDLGDGTYVAHIVSSQIGQAVVGVDVDGVVLDDRPTLTFQTVFQGEFLVNVQGVGDQSRPAAGQATNGGSVMIWQGFDDDGNGILGRVFNADGSPAGGEFVVNTTTAGDQIRPDVAVAANRSFVVVWQSADLDGSGIWAQQYDAAGQPFGGEMPVNVIEQGEQVDPRVVMADDGSFVVVWTGTDGDGEGIRARMFDSFGQAVSNEFPVNTAEAGDQQDPQAAMAGDGRFVVLWQSISGTDGIFAQLYTAAGAPLGPAIDVHLGLNGQEGIPVVAISDTGAFTAVWQGDDGQSIGIVARSFDAAGLPFSAAEVVVNTTASGVQDEPGVAMSDDGQTLVVWRDHSAKKVLGQRFDASAVAFGGEFEISDPSAVKPGSPVASLAGDGSSYLVLYEADDGDGTGVFASWVPLL